ncbi:MAG: amino acid ABC transporter substrate-binding protein [Rhodospirillales bacterium]|jgi:polar amino acid transport system substrate-binding protein|nr:amino acid ABC transporter substrate-binding protein [Rhodospirillales bacterium]
MKVFLSAIAFVFMAHLSAHADTIVLGTGEYAPYTSADLKNGGFVTEIVKRTFAEIGVETDIRFLPWRRGEVEAKGGKIDGVFSHIRSPERDTNFLVTVPINDYSTVMVVRESSPISSVEPQDLKGKRYCLPLGYADVAQFEAAYKAGNLKRHRVAGIDNCLKMLKAVRIDFAWEDELVLKVLFSDEFPNSANEFKTLLPPIDTNPGHLLISKKLAGGPALVEKFNLAFKTLKADGTIQKIFDSHFAQ